MSDVHMRQDYHDPDRPSKQQPDRSTKDNQEMDNLATRLQTAREEAKLSQTELAARAGCSQGLIGNLESGNQKTSSKLPALAQVLDVDALWLSEGKGLRKRPIAQSAQSVHPGDDRLAIRRALFKLSAGVSGYEVEYENGQSRPIYMDKSWFEARGFRSDKLVALKVNGRSMEPKMHEGDLVIVNTESGTPKDGVVFAVNYEGEMVIKRMRRDAGQWFITSDNPDKVRYGDKVCAEACFILGEIVYLQTDVI